MTHPLDRIDPQNIREPKKNWVTELTNTIKEAADGLISGDKKRRANHPIELHARRAFLAACLSTGIGALATKTGCNTLHGLPVDAEGLGRKEMHYPIQGTPYTLVVIADDIHNPAVTTPSAFAVSMDYDGRQANQPIIIVGRLEYNSMRNQVRVVPEEQVVGMRYVSAAELQLLETALADLPKKDISLQEAIGFNKSPEELAAFVLPKIIEQRKKERKAS